MRPFNHDHPQATEPASASTAPRHAVSPLLAFRDAELERAATAALHAHYITRDAQLLAWGSILYVLITLRLTLAAKLESAALCATLLGGVGCPGLLAWLAARRPAFYLRHRSLLVASVSVSNCLVGQPLAVGVELHDACSWRRLAEGLEQGAARAGRPATEP